MYRHEKFSAVLTLPPSSLEMAHDPAIEMLRSPVRKKQTATSLFKIFTYYSNYVSKKKKSWGKCYASKLDFGLK